MNRQRSSSTDREDGLIFQANQQLQAEGDPLKKLRLLCYSRGAGGILGFGKVFRRMDNDNSKSLNEEEFLVGIRETGLKLQEDEAKELFKIVDENGTGTIDYEEFIGKLRPPLSEVRVKLIESAYAKMDKNGDGTVTVEDLKGIYKVENNQQYLSGELSEDEILKNFLKKFEGKTTQDEKITPEEFLDYYSAVSASIDKDSYFNLMMRNTWGLE